MPNFLFGETLTCPTRKILREPRPGSFAGRSVHHAGAKAQVASTAVVISTASNTKIGRFRSDVTHVTMLCNGE